MDETLRDLKNFIGLDIQVGSYVLYVSDIEHVGKYKKHIWKVTYKEDNSKVKISNIANADNFTTDGNRLLNIAYVSRFGLLNADSISAKSLEAYAKIAISSKVEVLLEPKTIINSDIIVGKTYKAAFTTFTNNTINTTPERKNMKTTINDTIEKNSAAAKDAAIVVAGATLNQVVADQLVKQVPRKYKKLLKHPLANVVVANAASFIVQNFVAQNYKARVASDAMMRAAMQDFLRSFNIDQMVSEVLSNVNLSEFVGEE